MKDWSPENKLGTKACAYRLNAVADAIYAIGGKWKLRIVIALIGNTSRFNELQRTVKGISAKVLAAELKELELNGFIQRNVHTGTPVVVEYQLTEYALTLQSILDALVEWGAKHREKIMQGSVAGVESK